MAIIKVQLMFRKLYNSLTNSLWSILLFDNSEIISLIIHVPFIHMFLLGVTYSLLLWKINN